MKPDLIIAASISFLVHALLLGVIWFWGQQSVNEGPRMISLFIVGEHEISAEAVLKPLASPAYLVRTSKTALRPVRFKEKQVLPPSEATNTTSRDPFGVSDGSKDISAPSAAKPLDVPMARGGNYKDAPVEQDASIASGNSVSLEQEGDIQDGVSYGPPPHSGYPGVGSDAVTSAVTGAEGKSAAALQSPPQYKLNPAPSYPSSARQKGLEGKVILRVEVLENGGVGRIEVATSSGSAVLDQAATQSAKSWFFSPAVKDGRPVSQWVFIPVRFSLKD